MNNTNPHEVTKLFERKLAEYCGAPHAVAVTSCTSAILLSCLVGKIIFDIKQYQIPKYTYVSVPQSIINAGCEVLWREEEWSGYYGLTQFSKHSFNVYDSARLITSNMYIPGSMMCLSFHWTKTLSIGQGGAILLDNKGYYDLLKKLRFDGRTEGVAPKDDNIIHVGQHCYMSPRDAAEGLSRLSILPLHNDPLPNDDYPDLSKMSFVKA